MNFKPNTNNFNENVSENEDNDNEESDNEKTEENKKDGIYRPPKLAPVQCG